MARGMDAVDGAAFRLRPVVVADAAFIVWLRTQESLNSFLNPVSSDLSAQERWLGERLDRDDDCYFVVERTHDGRPEGAVALYDIGLETSGSAEWGRWVLRPDSLAAVESALLIYRVAFERMDLDVVYCRTVAENAATLSFHDACGIRERRVLPRYVTLNGVTHDSVEHRTTRSTWPAVRDRLGPLSERTARLVHRSTGSAP